MVIKSKSKSKSKNIIKTKKGKSKRRNVDKSRKNIMKGGSGLTPLQEILLRNRQSNLQTLNFQKMLAQGSRPSSGLSNSQSFLRKPVFGEVPRIPVQPQQTPLLTGQPSAFRPPTKITHIPSFKRGKMN